MTVLETSREKTVFDETWFLVFPRIDEDAEFRIGSPAKPFALLSP